MSYTFGGSYIRYGTPEVVEVADDPSHPHVIVRYRLWNGSSWEATTVAPAGITPGGHDCYSSGPIGNYLTSGCEHYGVSLRVSPTRTTYRWLIADDPNDVDSTFTALPQAVDLPVPVWSVAANPAGGVGVRAELEPVEEENHAQYGEPQWMKVFKIESELDLEPEDLVFLLLGADGNILPDETEVETEWKLIQSKPGNVEARTRTPTSKRTISTKARSRWCAATSSGLLSPAESCGSRANNCGNRRPTRNHAGVLWAASAPRSRGEQLRSPVGLRVPLSP